ncbi:hypothetical protein [uncultured Desulfuromusa sp.]|uniref:hypothetical protein n=1 Tax=uncultured Desulfuromusa sp. TaxID=219183 RepID=UPI002AA7EB21|nr:hypothetical protein [uncultured Desulfuromusa sp.]
MILFFSIFNPQLINRLGILSLLQHFLQDFISIFRLVLINLIRQNIDKALHLLLGHSGIHGSTKVKIPLG